MKNNKKKSDYIDILGDLEDISKHLYLESPELWIEFCDKVADEIIDEMVLFYASKYNHHNVLRFVEDNNILDLNSPSRNKNFSSIKTHLIAVSVEFNSLDVYQYLTKKTNTNNKVVTNNQNTKNTQVNTLEQSSSDDSSYFPKYICQMCNSNIFKSGYKVIEEIKYTYNDKTQKCEEFSRSNNKAIFCCNCNNPLKGLSLDLLEKICFINNCTKCGENLALIGIEQKVKMTLDKNNKFIPSQKNYVCPCCQNELNKYQLKFFNI